MYRIGEFARIVDISVRTLRYYDECGVLKPNEIDKFTGYRYYNDKNIAECELIKLLKYVDFTLDEIIVYKDNLNDDAIKKKQKELEEMIKLLKLKHSRLSLMSKELEDGKIKTYTRNSEDKVLRRNYEREINK